MTKRFFHFLFILYAILGVSVIAEKADEKCAAADEVDVSSCTLVRLIWI